jgi:hypothetical protein
MAKTTHGYEPNYEPIIYGLSTQLEALARVLSRVETVESDQDDPIITPKDFVRIMQLFQEKLYSLKDISGSLDGAVEDDKPTPLAAV